MFNGEKFSFIKDEKFLFGAFYGIQILITVIGLVRGTSFGYVLRQLEVSPIYLSLFFIIGILSHILSYFIFPYFAKKFNNPVKVLLLYEVIGVLALVISLIYIVYLYSTSSFGNFYIWSFLNLICFLHVSGTVSVKPLVLNYLFPSKSYNTIIRLDLISVSFSKLIGYMAGTFIFGIKGVLVVFSLALIVGCFAILFCLFLKNVNIKRRFVSTLNDIKEVKNSVYYSKSLTYLIAGVSSFFLFIISIQAVYLDRIYGIPFYYLLLFFAGGGLFFNTLFNKNISLVLNYKLKIKFIFIVFLFISLSYFVNIYIVSIIIFLLGGMYSTINNISITRLYSYSKTREPKSISIYYIYLSMLNIIGSLIVGFLFEYLLLEQAFLVWSLTLLCYLLIIIILNNYYKFDNLKI